MIKFFRKIREKLLSENKFSKYLVYAIGEIVLVVIGILIALQINNWNEDKKTRKIEVKLLRELKEDLIKTKEDLITDIEKTINLTRMTDSIYLLIYHDNVQKKNVELKIATSYLTDIPLLYAKLSAYKSIEANGINTISNDTLRSQISEFYELHLNRVSFLESHIMNLHKTSLKPYLKKFAILENDCIGCVTLKDQYSIENSKSNMYVFQDYDNGLLHILKEKYNLLLEMERRYLSLHQHIDDIIHLITEEIK